MILNYIISQVSVCTEEPLAAILDMSKVVNISKNWSKAECSKQRSFTNVLTVILLYSVVIRKKRNIIFLRKKCSVMLVIPRSKSVSFTMSHC